MDPSVIHSKGGCRRRQGIFEKRGGGSKAKEGILFWEEQAGGQQLLDRNTAVGINNEGKVKTAQHPGTHLS